MTVAGLGIIGDDHLEPRAVGGDGRGGDEGGAHVAALSRVGKTTSVAAVKPVPTSVIDLATLAEAMVAVVGVPSRAMAEMPVSTGVGGTSSAGRGRGRGGR